MSKIHREALLPYSNEMMYQLVNDVRRYPEFLPWCHVAEVHEQSDFLMRASIIVKKLGISKTFSTENVLELNRRVTMRLLNGPFKYLKGEWQFISIQDLGCKVILDLEFEFLPGLLNLPFKKVFEPAADSMLQSFVTQAHGLYGDKE